MSECCHPEKNGKKSKKDILFIASLWLVVVAYLTSYTPLAGGLSSGAEHFVHSVQELMNTMWWGLVAGILFVGVFSYVPQEIVMGVLGRKKGVNRIFRATLAGVFLDLCSHGILMVGMQLYKKGASLGQVMAFLIASPWNSISLTLILWALIGPLWMLTFLGLSLVIAMISGLIFDGLVKKGILPGNPNQMEEGTEIDLKSELKALKSQIKLSPKGLLNVIFHGMKEAKIVVKWLLFGVALASFIRVFINPETFADWFGPTVFGLFATALAATIVEVCSEGSVPLASDIFNKAGAPGNSFAFLMTGVSTDYTEVMILKDTTKSWKISLFLPLVTVPQILFLAFLLNQ